jgi:hypothetical protein
VAKAETNVPRFPVPLTFHPRDWVPLQYAVLQFISLVGGKRDLGLEIANQYLRNGQLGSALVAPDGTMKLLEASDWGRGRRTVHAPHNPAEGVSVEPYEAGYYFVRRTDLAELTSPAREPAARAEELRPEPTSPVEPEPAEPEPARRGSPAKYDWGEGFLFMRQELDRRGDPLDPLNAVDGWRSDADVARVVAAHIAIGGGPDLKHTERVIRPELKKWRAEQAERN